MPRGQRRRSVELRDAHRTERKPCGFDALAEDAPELRVRDEDLRVDGAEHRRRARVVLRESPESDGRVERDRHRPQQERAEERVEELGTGREHECHAIAPPDAARPQSSGRSLGPRVYLRPRHARLVLVAIEEPEPLGLPVIGCADECLLERVSHSGPAARGGPPDRRPTRDRLRPRARGSRGSDSRARRRREHPHRVQPERLDERHLRAHRTRVPGCSRTTLSMPWRAST